VSDAWHFYRVFIRDRLRFLKLKFSLKLRKQLHLAISIGVASSRRRVVANELARETRSRNLGKPDIRTDQLP